MKNIEEQQIIIECPNTIFHLYIDSEDELSKVKVFMNNMKNVDSISLHDIYRNKNSNDYCQSCCKCIKHVLLNRIRFSSHNFPLRTASYHVLLYSPPYHTRLSHATFVQICNFFTVLFVYNHGLCYTF